MTNSGPPPAKFKIEPFDPQKHDRTAFSCGVTQIDNFLKLTAKKQQKDDFIRVRVIVADGDSRVLGFHAINAHAIDAGELPAAFAKKAPRHGTVPAAYISMIGVDVAIQGQAIGKLLLADALKQILKASALIGTAVVMLDVFDDGNILAIAKRERYYRGFGFIPLQSRPLRLFLPLETVRQTGSMI
jgi:ribosomal protein S18 acetylase RimI-like enzyme